MSYARARLWLGISQLLCWLLLALAAIWLGFPEQLEQQSLQSGASWMLGLFLLGYTLLTFPFDYWGGYHLPEKYGRSTQSFLKWLGKWGRGAGIHLLYLWASGSLILVLARTTGLIGVLVWLIVQMFLLIGIRAYLALAIAPMKLEQRSHRGRYVLMLDSADKSFTGGLQGLPGMASLVLPAYWEKRFPEKVMDVLLARRHGSLNTGQYGRGILLAIGWNVLLFAAASFLSLDDLGTLSGLLKTILIFTALVTLANVGLLPSLSRKAVQEVDRWLYFKQIDADQLRKSIELTHHLQEDLSPNLSSFAPLVLSMPTAETRLSQLQSQQAVKGAWQVAKLSIFLSWSGLNLLGRSQPMQIGRPDLWVFAPGD